MANISASRRRYSSRIIYKIYVRPNLVEKEPRQQTVFLSWFRTSYTFLKLCLTSNYSYRRKAYPNFLTNSSLGMMYSDFRNSVPPKLLYLITKQLIRFVRLKSKSYQPDNINLQAMWVGGDIWVFYSSFF